MTKAKKIKAALHEEKKIVRDIVNERVNMSDRMALRKIKSGGMTDRDANDDSYIYGTAMNESRGYRALDNEPRDLVAGDMEGRRLSGRNGLFQTSINDIDDNACHGSCEIPFAQGFRRRGTEDFGIALHTPTQCVRDLDRLPRQQIEGYFRGFRTSFTEYGFQNFSDNLMNNVIKYGEANASVLDGNYFNVTKGGFEAPPVYRLTIHFLDEYRRYLISEMMTKSMKVPDNWMLEIELPMEDWKDAIRAHNLNVNRLDNGDGDLTRYHSEMLKDPEADMNGREFSDYGRIRCYFNEYPVRGIFRQSGTVAGRPNYNFVRIYPWKNEAGEEGGLVVVPNHDYDEDKVVVEGISYPMVTLAPHIHSESFKHYAFRKPVKQIGSANVGVNYDVTVLDGAYIQNNDWNDKFRLIARHEYRFKSMYPELSGFIAYRHGRRQGYVLEVKDRTIVTPEEAFSAAQDFKDCDNVSAETLENCATCYDGSVPESDGDCVQPENLEPGQLGLRPAGAARVAWTGSQFVARFEVRRTGEIAQTSTVEIQTAAVGAPEAPATAAAAGTHYTALATTTLTWEPGERDSKFVEVPITGGNGPDTEVVFDVTLANAVNATIVDGGDATRVTIEDLTVAE